MIEDLNKENSLLNGQKDELNQQILEQTRQLSGADPSPQSLADESFCPAGSELCVFVFAAEPRTTDEHTKQMEKTLAEERCRYQNLLSEHLHLEEQHRDLQEEMNLAKVRRTLWITAASSHLATD